MDLLEQLRSCLSDRYDIERELGGGGMSRVFVAVEVALSRRVVIKVLSPELGQAVNVDRFKQEIATSATLQHPQIIPVYGAGNCGDLLYYVMPFVAGESLRAHLEHTGRLSAREVARILGALARALAYAHREGVIHRDIKPENILLAQGEPMLADFGIAKVVREGGTHGNLTSFGTSIGTVTYMAPEQVVADPNIDGRADVYSLAALGFELLTGAPPFTGTPQQVMSAHVVKAPPSLAELAPDLPEGLRMAVERGLVKEVADRPDAAAFVELLDSSAPVVTGPTRVPVQTTKPLPRAFRMAAIGAVFGIVLAAAWQWKLRSSSDSASPTGPTTPVLPPAIAVLPFESVGDGGDDRYFSTGLTDELMTAIAQVPGLRVVSRSTVRAYADSTFTPAELGKKLGVRAFIEGSVQRGGARLRITARLIDVSTGAAMWSERYDREKKDVFTMQTEISQAIVTALASRLGTATTTTQSNSGTTNLDAYDLFLRARYAFDARELKRAIGLYRDALARDPRFARAHSGIAEAMALIPQYGGGTYTELAPEIRASAARALAIDTTLAAPHTALGLLAKGIGDWSVGEREFALALARQPNDGAVHHNLGEMLFTLGRFDESVVSLTRAAELEPQSATIVGEFAYALMLTGKLDSAERTIVRAIALDARNPFLHYTKGSVAEAAGRYADVLRSAKAAMERSSLPFFVGVMAKAQYEAGDTTAARATQAKIAAMGTVQGAALARAISRLPGNDQALVLEDLERAVAERDPLMFLLPMRMRWFDKVRNSARFGQLLDSLKLPATAGMKSH